MTDGDKTDKLAFGEYIELAQGLSTMNGIQAQKFVMNQQYSLKACFANFKRAIANREHEDIEESKVDEKVKQLKDAASPEAQRAWQKAEEASKWLMEQSPKGVYKQQPFQMHMIATICAKLSKKFVLSVHPPSAGKSWIAALLCAFYYLKNNNFKFLILTSDEVLKSQIDSQLRDYLRDLNITFTCTDFNHLNLKNYCVIVDEADLWVERNMVRFDLKNNLWGLESLMTATKVHFLTATATKFLVNMHRMLCNGDSSDAFFEF